MLYRCEDLLPDGRNVPAKLFKKLSYQKRIFSRRIKYEINEMEVEISLFQKSSGRENRDPIIKINHGLPSFKMDINQSLIYCHRREREYLEIYQYLLSKTHLGNIREMLINQKHAVQLIINEIKSLETKNQREKNEGEVNYR